MTKESSIEIAIPSSAAPPDIDRTRGSAQTTSHPCGGKMSNERTRSRHGDEGAISCNRQRYRERGSAMSLSSVSQPVPQGPGSGSSHSAQRGLSRRAFISGAGAATGALLVSGAIRPSSVAARPPTAKGPGSVSHARHLPEGFTDTFTSSLPWRTGRGRGSLARPGDEGTRGQNDLRMNGRPSMPPRRRHSGCRLPASSSVSLTAMALVDWS